MIRNSDFQPPEMKNPKSISTCLLECRSTLSSSFLDAEITIAPARLHTEVEVRISWLVDGKE